MYTRACSAWESDRAFCAIFSTAKLIIHDAGAMIKHMIRGANDAKKGFACLLTASATSICTQGSLLARVGRISSAGDNFNLLTQQLKLHQMTQQLVHSVTPSFQYTCHDVFGYWNCWVNFQHIHCVSKTRHLIVGHNFVRFIPIFVIISVLDSQENFVTYVMCYYTTLWSFTIQLLPFSVASLHVICQNSSCYVVT